MVNANNRSSGFSPGRSRELAESRDKLDTRGLACGGLFILELFLFCYVLQYGLPLMQPTTEALDARNKIDYVGDSAITSFPSWYEGTIGNMHVGLRLHYTKPRSKTSSLWTGSYYSSQMEIDRCFTGECDEEGNMRLYEIDQRGKQLALLNLHFQQYINSETLKIHVTGSRESINKSRTEPVELEFLSIDLGPDLPHLVDPKAKAFRDAIVRGDKMSVAKMINYPTDFWVADHRLQVSGADVLLHNYDAIFTKQLVEQLSPSLSYPPCELFYAFVGSKRGAASLVTGKDKSKDASGYEAPPCRYRR